MFIISLSLSLSLLTLLHYFYENNSVFVWLNFTEMKWINGIIKHDFSSVNISNNIQKNIDKIEMVHSHTFYDQ